MLSNTKGRKHDIYVPDYVVYDLETTGTSYQKDKILEIGAVKVRSGKVVDEFESLVNPECNIPYQIIQVNGIDNEMVGGNHCSGDFFINQQMLGFVP